MKERMLDLTFKYGTVSLIAAVIVIFGIIEPNFLNAGNLTDILRAIAIVTFVAIGVTFSQIVDGFDLSVSSTVSISTVVSASLMVWYQQPLIVVIMVPLLIGAIIGLINSFLIIRWKVPDLLATLAVMYIISGVHRTYTEGYSIYNNMQFSDGTKAPGVFDAYFLQIGQGKVLGIPIMVILMLAAVAGAHIFLQYTRWGRQFYMTGGNREAARLSGIPIHRIRMIAYVISGVCAAFAGILFASRVGTGQIDAGAPLLMESVAAVFVGYSVFGAGKPNIIGTFFGAVLIGVLLNGLTMLRLPYYGFDIVKGAVLVIALAATYIHLTRKKHT
jgi:simple sugar transport system permease protein